MSKSERCGATAHHRFMRAVDTAAMSTLTAHQEISPARLRATLRSFATGVTVVTSAGDGESCGMTVNAFAPVSLKPALVLVCLGTDSATSHAIERHGVFAVNVLSARQQWLSRRFSAPDRPRGHDAFAGVAHRTGWTGAPILDGVASWLDCRLQAIHPAGDHVIALGEVLDLAGEAQREPLLFHDGRYRIVRDPDRAPGVGPTLAPDLKRRR